MVIVIKQKRSNFFKRFYLFDILASLYVTGRRFFTDVVFPRFLVEHHEHRLMLNPDGEVNCSACLLCQGFCPAQAILVTKTGHGASEFKIDYAKCLSCGFCVDACPCDAIRMDVVRLGEKMNGVCNLAYLKSNHGGKTPHSVVKEE